MNESSTIGEWSQSIHSPGLPMLDSVLDPAELEKHLKKTFSSSLPDVRVIRVQPLVCNHRRRCIVDVVLQTPSGEQEVIGKVYSDDRSDVYKRMEQISKSIFAADNRFRIPKVLAYVPRLNLLLQEKIIGIPASKIFEEGSYDQCAQTAERAGKWLARFHSYGTQDGEEPFVLTGELMRVWAQRLEKKGSSNSIKKGRLLYKQLVSIGAKQHPEEICASHGGYWHKQIILNKESVVVIDWDNHCISAPSRDVAKFIIELQQLALKSLNSIRAFDGFAEIFYETYRQESEFNVDSGLAFYKAATCLRRAQSHLRKYGGGNRLTEATLDEGLRVLDEEL